MTPNLIILCMYAAMVQHVEAERAKLHGEVMRAPTRGRASHVVHAREATAVGEAGERHGRGSALACVMHAERSESGGFSGGRPGAAR